MEDWGVLAFPGMPLFRWQGASCRSSQKFDCAIGMRAHAYIRITGLHYIIYTAAHVTIIDTDTDIHTGRLEAGCAGRMAAVVWWHPFSMAKGSSLKRGLRQVLRTILSTGVWKLGEKCRQGGASPARRGRRQGL